MVFLFKEGVRALKVEELIARIKEEGGYVRSGELRSLGVHPSVLPALAREGILVRVKRGLYALPDATSGDERLEALLSVPGSVLCLGSALSIHGIGTWEPPEIYLAIQTGRRILVPDSMPIRLFHFAKSTFSMGILEQPMHGRMLRYYDAERTVCDLFRLRHLLGGDVAVEALREYLKRKKRNIPKILDYAGKLNIRGTLEPLLEALV